MEAITAPPSAFSDDDIHSFVKLVLSANEVSRVGLHGRVMGAAYLVFLRKDSKLIGVAGLKVPALEYRQRVSISSGLILPAEKFPFELGWVVLHPDAQGKRFSVPLCHPLIEASNGNGIFATSRSKNVPMHRTLQKLGFDQAGKAWPSRQNHEMLRLFVKAAA